MDRFENAEGGTWLVDIGGYIAGDEHDLLIVSGGAAQLDGFLNVDLIDAGAGLFLPQIGDEFTVLRRHRRIGLHPEGGRCDGEGARGVPLCRARAEVRLTARLQPENQAAEDY